MFVKFTRVSSNAKTGPIPVTMTSSDSCPSACPLSAGGGCYASYGMTGMHWRKTDKGTHAGDWDDMLENIKALPKGQLWRHNVAGDLPHINQLIDGDKLIALVEANKNKRGFTYTHHDMNNEFNRNSVAYANRNGFTVNLSANNPDHADELKALNIGPVAVIMPEDAPKVSTTPEGNTIVLCPATYRDDIQCANCAICAESNRQAIIGFPVHGSGKKKALASGKQFKTIMLARA